MKWKNEFRLTRDNGGWWGRTDLAITIFLVIGLALNAWGIVSNAVVIMANNDTMPVISDGPIVLLENEGVPRVLTNEGKLLLLADHIRVDFPDVEEYVPGGYPGKMVRWWSKFLNYPLEGGLNMVSIGDVMRWTGSALFLLMIPLTIFASMRRMLSGDLPRILK